jgi:hypothetical protein
MQNVQHSINTLDLMTAFSVLLTIMAQLRQGSEICLPDIRS